MTELMTQARQAVWAAIEAFPETTGLFSQKYIQDGELPQLPDNRELAPDRTALNAIDIFPKRSDPNWFLNNLQLSRFVLGVRMWIPTWRADTAESMFGAVRRAVWQAADGDDQNFIAAYDCDPEFEAVSFRRVTLGSGDVTRATLIEYDLVLKLRDNPREAVA